MCQTRPFWFLRPFVFSLVMVNGLFRTTHPSGYRRSLSVFQKISVYPASLIGLTGPMVMNHSCLSSWQGRTRRPDDRAGYRIQTEFCLRTSHLPLYKDQGEVATQVFGYGPQMFLVHLSPRILIPSCIPPGPILQREAATQVGWLQTTYTFWFTPLCTYYTEERLPLRCLVMGHKCSWFISPLAYPYPNSLTGS